MLRTRTTEGSRHVAISNSVTTPVNPADDVVTIFENINDGSGDYYFRFETIYGLRREETGELVNAGQPDQYIEVHGEYSYHNPEGKLHVIKYTADENGYRFESKDKPSRPYFDPNQITLGTFTSGTLPAHLVATLLSG